VDVHATGQAVVNVALHHRRVGSGLHLKPSNAVAVDVVAVKVTL